MTVQDSEIALRALAVAERRIALLARLTPLNLRKEQARLLEGYCQGRELIPAFVYGPPPVLSELRRGLALVAEEMSRRGVTGGLVVARARELDAEAALAENLESPDFSRWAALRFPQGTSGEEARLSALIEVWLAEGSELVPETTLRHRSEDPGDPESLWSVLSRTIGERRWPFRVVLDEGLLAEAATGWDCIALRPGRWLTDAEVARVVLHELEGHARPRAMAQRKPSLWFTAGPPGTTEDEEGFALYLEDQSGMLTRGRRFVLALRHCAGVACRQGASFPELVRLLRGYGAEWSESIDTALRVVRGGGLAREVIYLPAWARVTAALKVEPRLGNWFRQGRMSLGFARALEGSRAAPTFASLEETTLRE